MTDVKIYTAPSNIQAMIAHDPYIFPRASYSRVVQGHRQPILIMDEKTATKYAEKYQVMYYPSVTTGVPSWYAAISPEFPYIGFTKSRLLSVQTSCCFRTIRNQTYLELLKSSK